jgi:hypothetical protein
MCLLIRFDSLLSSTVRILRVFELDQLSTEYLMSLFIQSTRTLVESGN